MPEGEEKSPFDFETETSKHKPALTVEIVNDLKFKIKAIPEEKAREILDAAAKKVQERESNSEVLEFIMKSALGFLGAIF